MERNNNGTDHISQKVFCDLIVRKLGNPEYLGDNYLSMVTQNTFHLKMYNDYILIMNTAERF